MKSRTEQEMFDLILSTARSDERIRAVVLNGSRADPDAKADCFQDYDIVFVVKDVRSFVSDPLWIDRFGELMILQLPTDWYAHPYDYDKGEPFTYLMQFMDGTRIDLTLDTGYIDNGEPAVALLDKDDRLSNLPAPSSSAYCVKAPGRKEYCDCCNEFWWLGPYIAKGLWRKELPT
jgi:aminoglycoside 6-adenylyltransferase